jgi:hypothetical protein
MHKGIAPPHGLALSSLRSIKKVSIPAFANVSAAEEPAGPDPTTATRSAKGFSPKSLYRWNTPCIYELWSLDSDRFIKRVEECGRINPATHRNELMQPIEMHQNRYKKLSASYHGGFTVLVNWRWDVNRLK